MKISVKIALLVISLSLVYGIAFVYLTSVILRDRLHASQNEWAGTLVHAISEGITLNTINGDVLKVREKLEAIVNDDPALEYAYVTDFDGYVLTHTFEGGFPKELIHKTHDRLTAHQHEHTLYTTAGIVDDISYPLIKGMDAHVHVGVNQNKITALIQVIHQEILLLVILITLAGASLAVLFGRRIATPLHQLVSFMQAYGRGEVPEPTDIANSSHEMRVLASTFANMIEDRQSLEHSLNEKDVIYRRLVGSTTAIPWVLDLPTWRFTYIGSQIVKLLGYPVDDWYTERFWEDHLHPDDRDSAVTYCHSETAAGQNHEFEYRMISADNSVVWIRNDVTVIHEDGAPARLQGFMFDITDHKLAEHERQQHMELMQKKQYAFMEWAKSSHIDLKETFHKASELAAEALKTNRVSIWFYNPEHTAIYCEDIYVSQDKKHDEGMQLKVSDFPSYFKALETSQVLAVSDARTAPETNEFTDSYLIPLDIHSMLDVPIHTEGKVIGVVCHEQTGEQREWTLEEQDYATSIAGTVALAIETEERKRAEKELQEYRDHLEDLVDKRTAELGELNRELESFSYSVSHDLRAPLRAIDGFSRILHEDYEKEVDEQGKDYIQRIRNNTHRMGRLIDDLLNLSRLGRANLDFEKIDLGEIANSVISDLHSMHEDNNVRCHVSNTGPVVCDSGLIRIVLENLLGNAWKYTSNTKNPYIEFGVASDTDEAVYYVKDNGVGFDMDHASKLFGAFQRLHGNDYEGTGIGLATVKRIIGRHGGRIWAEANVNHGATFYFTLGQMAESSSVLMRG